MSAKKIVIIVGLLACIAIAWPSLKQLLPARPKSPSQNLYVSFNWDAWPVSKETAPDFKVPSFETSDIFKMKPKIIYPIDLLSESQNFNGESLRKQFFSSYVPEYGLPTAIAGTWVQQGLEKLSVTPFGDGLVLRLKQKQNSVGGEFFNGEMWWYFPTDDASKAARCRDEFARAHNTTVFNFMDERPLFVFDYTPGGFRTDPIIHVYDPTASPVTFFSTTLNQRIGLRKSSLPKAVSQAPLDKNIQTEKDAAPAPTLSPKKAVEASQEPLIKKVVTNGQTGYVLTRTPKFDPGVSKLYNAKEILSVLGTDMENAWIYGQFTVKRGGAKRKEQLSCWEAGAQTQRVTGALLGNRINDPAAWYSFGWQFQEVKFPSFMDIGANDVVEISQDAPAKILNAHTVQGVPSIVAILITPPKKKE